MELLDVGRVVAGLALLVGGGELLVRGAAGAARIIGISPLVVGLLVVSAATSAPELAVTIDSVARGEPGLAVGNVVGSNIVNVLLILGLSAAVAPLLVKRQLVRLDLPVMLGVSVLFLVLSLDGALQWWDGLILVACLVVHSVVTVRTGRRADVDTPDREILSAPVAALLVALGVGVLVGGANLLVGGAVDIAAAFGVSGLVVGLTVVAIGTSLPELATSLVALRRGERDMAVGNIIGSNIFNIALVLGLPALLFPGGIPVPSAAIALDIPLMIAASAALLPIAFTGFVVARWEGSLFVCLYVAYVAYVVLAATRHDALTGFTSVMLWFVLPLLATTLVVLATYEVGLLRGRRQAENASGPGSVDPGPDRGSGDRI